MSSCLIFQGLWAAALERRGPTYVYTKVGTRVPNLNTVQGFGVYTLNNTGGRRKMFITRENATSWLSSCWAPSQALSLGWNCFMTMGSSSYQLPVIYPQDFPPLKQKQKAFFCNFWFFLNLVRINHMLIPVFLTALKCWFVLTLQSFFFKFHKSDSKNCLAVPGTG